MGVTTAGNSTSLRLAADGVYAAAERSLSFPQIPVSDLLRFPNSASVRRLNGNGTREFRAWIEKSVTSKRKIYAHSVRQYRSSSRLHSASRRPSPHDGADRPRLAILPLRKPESEEPDAPPIVYPYIQWQIIQSTVSKLFLAIDTSLGDPETRLLLRSDVAGRRFSRAAEGHPRPHGEPLLGCRRIDLCLRAATATAGEAKPVHLVVDFGNSRTGALLVEMSGEVSQIGRNDAVRADESLQARRLRRRRRAVSRPAAGWFSSKDPLVPPPTDRRTKRRRPNTIAIRSRACSARRRSHASGRRSCGRICSTTCR